MRLSKLVVYPVKSCAGISVDAWRLDERGLLHDRSFMIVDADSGAFLTQREYPALALVRPAFAGDLVQLVCAGGAVSVPLHRPGPRITISVWEHTGPALDCGNDVAALLSDHLGRSVRLVALAAGHGRTAEADWAGPRVPVGFSDGYPLLITGAGSLDALNARLPRPLPMNRFRPNLVVSGAEPFAEDDWARIRIAGVMIDVVKPCTRCTITTVDQATGKREGAEPLRELGTFRRGSRGVVFGMNAVHRGPGTLRVGDEVHIDVG